MEYITITKDFIIEEMSFGVKRFAESITAREFVEIDQDCRIGFPELIGMENILRQVHTGEKPSLELKGISRQNQPKPLYIDIYALGTQDHPHDNNHYLLILFEDVTERMLLEQSLAQRSNEAALLLSSLTATKNYLQEIITAIADALIVVTKSGYIKTVNPAAQSLFGYKAEELINQPLSVITSPHIFPDGLPHSIEVKCHRKDNSIITVAFSCSIIQTEVVGIDDFVYIGRDITEQLQIKENLNLARTQAEEASQSKSLFLANMSHEIRTPMHGVLGLAELLNTTNLEPMQREFVEGIQTSGKNLLKIINEILDLSKLEAGQIKTEVYEFDLRNCVEDVVDLLAPLAHQKKLELTCMINPQLPISIWGDGARLGQILTNFLSNAIKFTSKGEILVIVEPDAQTGIRFTVIDQGIGISSETLLKLFTPFTQADNSTTRKYGGTGLGLAICKHLTNLMGGKIGVESKLGKGSSFWASVPYAVSKINFGNALADRPSDQDSQISKLTGLNLLVIDPHATTRWLISTYAQYWQMQVSEASSKQEALDFLSSNHQPELIIMDIDMANTPEFVHLPVIVTICTNRVESQMAIAKNCGYNSFLTKPLRPMRMLKTIQNILPDLPTAVRVNRAAPNSLGVLNFLLATHSAINQKILSTLLMSLGHTIEIPDHNAEILKLLDTRNYDIVLIDCQMSVLDESGITTLLIDYKKRSDRPSVIIGFNPNATQEDQEKCLAMGVDDYLSKPFSQVAIETMLQKWIKTAKVLNPLV